MWSLALMIAARPPVERNESAEAVRIHTRQMLRTFASDAQNLRGLNSGFKCRIDGFSECRYRVSTHASDGTDNQNAMSVFRWTFGGGQSCVCQRPSVERSTLFSFSSFRRSA